VKVDMNKKILIANFFVVMVMLVSFNAVAYNPNSSVIASEFEYDLKLGKESSQEYKTAPAGEVICSVLMLFYNFFDGLESVFEAICRICTNIEPTIFYYLAVLAGTMADAFYGLAGLAGCY